MVIIDVEFPLLSYSGRNEKGKTEHIPSPSKLLAAFLATACREETFLESLRLLEEQQPVIYMDNNTSYQVQPTIFERKKPNLKTEKNNSIDRSQITSFAQKTGQSKQIVYDDVKVFCNNHVVSYVYDLHDEHVEKRISQQLSHQSGKIGYLGRSTTPVVVHVYTSDHVDAQERTRYVPGAYGKQVSIAQPGYIDYLIKRYDNESVDISLPFHLMKNVSYQPVRMRKDGRSFTTITFPAQSYGWGEKIARITQSVHHDVAPLVTPNGKLFAITADVEDHKIADFTLAAIDAFGEDVEYLDKDYNQYLDAASTWVTYTSALLDGNSVLAEAKVLADLMEQTGLSLDEIEVEIIPNLYKKNKVVTPISTKTPYYDWIVLAKFAQPVQGPLSIGKMQAYGCGRMKHAVS